MDRSALLAALVAATAAIAFVLGAAAFGPTIASQDAESGVAEGPDEPPEPREANGSSGSTAGEGGGSDASCSQCPALDLRSQVATLLPAVDPRILLGVLAFAVVGLAAVGLRTTDDAPDVESESTGDVAPGDRHRDRPATPAPDGDVAPTNDVYRAWLALGAAVDEPRTGATSPRQRARRAIDAGLPDGPVESLTSTFEAVRYGPADPTAEHERRARAAIDRLEGVELPSDPSDQTTDDSTESGSADAEHVGRHAGGDR